MQSIIWANEANTFSNYDNKVVRYGQTLADEALVGVCVCVWLTHVGCVSKKIPPLVSPPRDSFLEGSTEVIAFSGPCRALPAFR